MNQTETILQHLKTYGFISSFEAFALYHITRLSARVFELRKTYNIKDVWVSKGKSSYVNYTLGK